MESHRPNVDRFGIRQKELETEFDRLSRLGEPRARLSVMVTMALKDAWATLEFKRRRRDRLGVM